MLTPIFDKAHSKIIESWDTINFRVPQSDWLHSIITMPSKRFFDQVLIYVNFINMQKSGYSIWRYGWLRNLAIWLAENNSAHILETKIFPNMEFVSEHSK